MAVVAELETIAKRVVEHIDLHVLPQWEKRIFETVDQKLATAAQPQSTLAAYPELLERIVRVEEELKAQGKRIELLIHQMDKRFEQVDKRFEQVDKRFEQIDKRFEELIHYMDKRFEQVDKRFIATQRAIFIGFTVIAALMSLFRFLQ